MINGPWHDVVILNQGPSFFLIKPGLSHIAPEIESATNLWKRSPERSMYVYDVPVSPPSAPSPLIKVQVAIVDFVIPHLPFHSQACTGAGASHCNDIKATSAIVSSVFMSIVENLDE